MSNEEMDPILREWHAGSSVSTKETKRGRGRPKGGFQAAIDWELAEQLYVEGDVDAESGVRVYPLRKAIAARAGTTANNLDQRCKRYRWVERRRLFQIAMGITAEEVPDLVRQKTPQVIVSAPPTVAADTSVKSRKKSRRDPLAVLDTYIGQFADAIARRRVRFDTIADFERAVRLRAFCLGQADSIKQTHVTVSLEIMQQRHKAARAYVGETVDDAVAGVLGRHVPAAVDAEFTEHGPEDEASAHEGVPVSSAPVRDEVA